MSSAPPAQALVFRINDQNDRCIPKCFEHLVSVVVARFTVENQS